MIWDLYLRGCRLGTVRATLAELHAELGPHIEVLEAARVVNVLQWA